VCKIYRPMTGTLSSWKPDCMIVIAVLSIKISISAPHIEYSSLMHMLWLGPRLTCRQCPQTHGCDAFGTSITSADVNYGGFDDGMTSVPSTRLQDSSLTV